jgi:hypothetical protein
MNIEEPKVLENMSKKEKLARALSDFCAKSGNLIKFEKDEKGKEIIGEDYDLEKNEIKSEILKDINEGEAEFVSVFIGAFKTYLSGAIFTDSFGENHGDSEMKDGTRRGWEKKWEGKEVTPEEKERTNYYNSNRLGANNCGQVTYWEMFLMSFKDSEIKNKLLKLEEQIPKEFIEKILVKGENNKEENKIIYLTLKEDERIECVKRLSEVVKNTLSLLEK